MPVATSIGTVRATTTRAPSSTSSPRAFARAPSTNHVAPLPASTGAAPTGRRSGRASAAARARRRAPPARGRWVRRRRGPPRSSHARYTAGVLTASGGMTSVTTRSTWASGSTISPMPRTRARPPTRQNGMSAPSREARSKPTPTSRSRTSAARRRHRSSRRRGRRRGGSACRGAPPTSPTWPASRRARATRLVPSSGIPSAERARGVEAVPAGSQRDQVVQVEADHLGVDQVVAVVADTGDAQPQRELGVGSQGDGPTGSRRRRRRRRRVLQGPCRRSRRVAHVVDPAARWASARRHHASTSSSSGRAVGAMPAAS